MAYYIDTVNNPTQWRLTDSIILVEKEQPAPATIGEGDGRVGIVGQFPWGAPHELHEPLSSKQLQDMLFGQVENPEDWGGYRALTGKQWSKLYIVRVEADDAAAASRTIASSTPEDIFKITVKYKTSAGNQIKVKYTKVSADVFELEFQWGNETRKYEALDRATDAFDGIEDAWVNLEWLDADASEALPDSDADFVALTGGDDGTLVATDWSGSDSVTKGLRVLRQMPNRGIVFAAEYTSAAWLTALVSHCIVKDCKGVALADDGDVFADAVTAAGGIANEFVNLMGHRVKQFIEGELTDVDLSPFYASVFAAIDPSESVAQKRWGDRFLTEIKGVVGDVLLEREFWIEADQAGMIMLERMSNGNYKFHMDITSDTTPGKTSSLRRRMHSHVNELLAIAHEPFANTKPTDTTVRRQNSAVTRKLNAMVDLEMIEDYSHELTARDGSSTTWKTKVKLWGEQRYIINTTEVGENVVITTE